MPKNNPRRRNRDDYSSSGNRLTSKSKRSNESYSLSGIAGPSVSKRRRLNGPLQLGFKKLEEFSTEEPEELILKLKSTASGSFSELLHSSSISHDTIVLIVKLLSKVSECSFTFNKITLLEMASTETFVLQLSNFILLTLYHTNDQKKNATYFWKDVDGFFKNLLGYFEMLFSLLPYLAIDVLPKLLQSTTATIFKLEVSADIKKSFEKINNKVTLYKEQISSKRGKGFIHDLEPPDDFRLMSLYPLPVEITSRTMAFVRPNIIEGSYRDVDHYLDVQFRLLREDFVKPLREGICDYMSDSHKKVQNIKIYKNVRFDCLRVIKGISGVMVQLEIKEKQRFRKQMENSRRFMYGSLMCFTSDNFKSLIFGKVVDRKSELLQQGQLFIELEPGFDEFEHETPYLMVESSVYFEPYYHVLKALKQLQEYNFPMKKYIVDVSTDVEPPQYLKLLSSKSAPHINEPISPTHSLALEYSPESPTYRPTSPSYRPTSPMSPPHNTDQQEFPIDAEKPGTSSQVASSSVDYESAVKDSEMEMKLKKILNDSQYRAFQSAINQSFSIIQGPPGTGKTYLGLIIANYLLKNHSEWHQGCHPLLVVCYTNHALDQFLEGLLQFTTEIVRIGGQSKNEKMEEYNIRNIRKTSNVHLKAFYEARNGVRNAQEHLERLHKLSDEIKEFEDLINVLGTVKSLKECRNTWFADVQYTDFYDWLLVGHENILQKAGKLSDRNRNRARRSEQYQDYGWENDSVFESMNETRLQLDDEDMFDSYDIMPSSSISIISCNGIKKELEKLRGCIKAPNETAIDAREDLNILRKISELENKLYYIEMRLEEGRSIQNCHEINYINLNIPHAIHPDDRWKLYFYWLNLHQISTKKDIEKSAARYKSCHKAYEEFRNIQDTLIMKKMLVVGMTTTAAARLQGTLRALKPPIVIVEEAAEIMEAHVVTSLTEHCKHLILIGDHQQLRPTTADFTMNMQYNLGISLFERMIQNKINCNVLSVQHRMRPEIAQLVAPSIYPNLENHDSVHHFPPVCGVKPSLYFVTHSHLEVQCINESKKNLHEVKFLVRFAHYLIMNGYKPDDITILAAYSGQMIAMFKERKEYPSLKDVRITVLDNYQGEESKIILLSLVRNNKEGKIGFLSIENRVCVALSRAREGLYIMGNMDLLCSNSTIWPKVRKVLDTQDSLGTSLPLQCQVHPDNVTYVASEADFSNSRCELICAQELDCGHDCKLKCHIDDRNHEFYKCREKCIRILCDQGHVCPKTCFKTCGNCVVPMLRKLKCGHETMFPCYVTEFECSILVSAELPCKHKVDNKPCHLSVDLYKCPYRCDARLSECGHACKRNCHVNNDPDHLKYQCQKPCVKYQKGCSKKTKKHICPKKCYEECPTCNIQVEKKRSCSHVSKVDCSYDVEGDTCIKRCDKMLPCGLTCRLQCSAICICTTQVMKTVQECGHKILIECHKEPSRSCCREPCSLSLPCGHKCKHKCKSVCTTKCKELVDNPVELPCGHLAKIPCYLNNTDYINCSNPENLAKVLSYCEHPCSATLECGHNCSGTCVECYQGRIHKICKEDCGLDLLCGHKCRRPCRRACPPCSVPCLYKCSHSKCKKRCGDICTPCMKPCPRQCKHVSCKARCGETCTIDPCTEPCRKFLKCYHKCIGFCGEPCPSLCIICNREELLDFCLGYEEDEGARFVLLEECNHVIESTGMELWLAQDENAINVKRCPKCRTPLTMTRRFNEYIKKSIDEIQKVKVKYWGEQQDNKSSQKALSIQFTANCFAMPILKPASMMYVTVYERFRNKLSVTYNGRNQVMSKISRQILTSKIQIFQDICKLLHVSSKEKSQKSIAYMDFLLKRLIANDDRMTGQEIDDFAIELKRLRRIFQLDDIEQRCPAVLQNELYKSIYGTLYSIEKYAVEKDEELRKNLEELSKEKGVLIVSDKELQQIVKAIGVKHGAWYKCPNGHPYAIGQCGGANQVSECADCGAVIGGRQHRLVDGNQHFNVDGSRYSAWSEQANMANYEFH